MAFQSVPGVWQLELSGTVAGGKFWEINLYARPLAYSQPSQVVCDALMDAIQNAYISENFDDVLATDWNFNKLTVTGLDAISDAQIVSDDFGVNGNDGSQGLPPQCCALGTWRTGLRGRSYTGRIYHPGLTEAHSNNGLLDNTFLTNYNNWASEVTEQFDAAEFPLVVVSRFSGTELQPTTHGQVELRPVKREEGISTQITSFAPKQQVATQRRRAVHP